MPGAYRPTTPLARASAPKTRPNSSTSSTFQVEPMTASLGKETPLRELTSELMPAGPSRSEVAGLPTEATAGVDQPPLRIMVAMSSSLSCWSSSSHLGSSQSSPAMSSRVRPLSA